jgi:ATP-dependent Clp protease ATP-binding subunit ClpC
MFERYTEKARRVIFFARYEALQYGSQKISPEHILLGLMREDKTLSARFFPFRHSLTVEAVRRDVEERIVLRTRIPQSAELHLAAETKRVLAFAHEESERLGNRHIGVEHLLLGILREEESIAAEILYNYGLNLVLVREKLAHQNGTPNRRILDKQRKESPNLYEFTRDLTLEATEGKLDPLIGRELETERVVEILCRRTKNNPVLIGESGVGKTAIIEGLAQRISDGRVPTFLENKRILSLDLSLIVAGTKYRGQFEERLKKIMAELKENPQFIVFIDELHTLVGAGSAEGSLDAANILKPALSRGEIQCVGATTPSEYRKSIEKDRSLERRFQAVKVVPPTETEALEIIEGIADRYEAFHQIRYSKEALHAAVYQTSRYIPERFLPDKAIDVLDEAGARAKLRYQQEKFSEPAWKEAVENWKKVTDEENLISFELETFDDSFFAVEVTKDDVEEVIARWTGIPVQSIKVKRLLN